MDIPKIQIPKSREKIIEQILALEWTIGIDNNEKDREIHQEALHELRNILKNINIEDEK